MLKVQYVGFTQTQTCHPATANLDFSSSFFFQIHAAACKKTQNPGRRPLEACPFQTTVAAQRGGYVEGDPPLVDIKNSF